MFVKYPLDPYLHYKWISTQEGIVVSAHMSAHASGNRHTGKGQMASQYTQACARYTELRATTKQFH